MPTVSEIAEEMRAEVRPAAERVGIEVNSINMWPMLAIGPFLEACTRLEKLEAAVRLECEMGCEGAFDEVCLESGAPQEDWCGLCRLSYVLSNSGNEVS